MNQHYVPRAYLKHFAIKKGKEYFVDIYDKKADRYFHSNIKRICSEIDIYTLQKDSPITKDPLMIEKIYANGFEPLYLKAYDILTNHRIAFISQLQRADILIAIFQLYVRNPVIVKRSISFHNKEIERLWTEANERRTKGMTYLDEDFSFKEWTKDKIKEFIALKTTNTFKEKHIGGIGEIGNFHEHAIIEINVIRDETEFITSDNPLVVEDYVVNDIGPLMKTKEFFVALNKKVALRLYHDKTKAANVIYRLEIPNLSVEIINQRILEQASRFIVASKEKLEIHSRMAADFLDNYSLELKIDSMRQILSKFPIDNDTRKKSAEVMRYYLTRYETKGTLTDLEVYEMTMKLKKIQADFILSRVN